ncbi:MAG TPA: hypothetical protein VGP23_03645 [Candidatus Binataceae bacterium]|nr:hypothetical protein [Candidatus Binataceae bacterium]
MRDISDAAAAVGLLSERQDFFAGDVDEVAGRALIEVPLQAVIGELDGRPAEQQWRKIGNRRLGLVGV